MSNLKKFVIQPYSPLWISKSGNIKNDDFLIFIWAPNHSAERLDILPFFRNMQAPSWHPSQESTKFYVDTMESGDWKQLI